MGVSDTRFLFDEDDQSDSPAAAWDHDVSRRALDELFVLARQYKSSREYHDLLQFVARFRFYSPFNAMLVHAQMPGATFVAPPHRWARDYGRRIKAGQRPLVILQPKGPVMFVFDAIQTEPVDEHSRVPPQVDRPFEVLRGKIGSEFDRSIENAKRDGIEIAVQQAGSQSAGLIRTAQPGRNVRFNSGTRSEPRWETIPLRYELLLNANHSREAQYATLIHELAHLYCGHLGSPNTRWWPDRRGLRENECEFEAESVCYLVCARRGIENPSHKYLAGYVVANADTPAISLDCVMKTAGLIEQMGRGALKLRKKDEA